MAAFAPVLVMGAGSIGCFVGGRLAAAGVPVHFVGRPRVLTALRERGLTVSDLEASTQTVPAAALSLHEHPSAAAAAGIGLVLLCVKSAATAEAAALLQQCLPAGTPVLSLQNGVSNALAAQAAAPALQLIPGMVPFNVAELAPGHYHRGTTGALAAQRHPALQSAAAAFERAALPLQLHADLFPVQWGKLLLNLNNPVNALSGLPLRAQLLDREFRRATAALQQEALRVLQAAHIQPAQLTPLPPQWLPSVLRLPTPLFRLLAARMLRIDERARSSMADDLAQGRRTEVDVLCGEIVRLARALNGPAPVNARMTQLVQQWPQRQRPYSGRELLDALGLD